MIERFFGTLKSECVWQHRFRDRDHAFEEIARSLDRYHADRPHSACRKRRFRVTTDSRNDLPVGPNVLARQFDVPAPNRAWVTDITYIGRARAGCTSS